MDQWLVMQNGIIPAIVFITFGLIIFIIWKKIHTVKRQKRIDYYARIKKCEDEHWKKIFKEYGGGDTD